MDAFFLGVARQIRESPEQVVFGVLGEALWGAVIEEAQQDHVRVAVAGDPLGERYALLVHPHDHDSLRGTLEVEDVRRRHPEEQVPGDQAYRCRPGPGDQDLRVELLDVAACIAKKQEQGGDADPAEDDVPHALPDGELEPGRSGEGQREDDQRKDEVRRGDLAFAERGDAPQGKHHHERLEQCLHEIEQVAPANRKAGGPPNVDRRNGTRHGGFGRTARTAQPPARG